MDTKVMATLSNESNEFREFKTKKRNPPAEQLMSNYHAITMGFNPFIFTKKITYLANLSIRQKKLIFLTFQENDISFE